MPKATVYDMAGSPVGEIELSDSVFGITPNKTAMHAAVVNHLANKRQGTQNTLTRAEVSGGGIKPWRQKGTGRARQGSIRAPQWTHGGIAFGPKPRDYSYTINKKLRRLAIKSALSAKAAANEIVVIRDLNMAEIKTKSFKSFLDAVNVSGKALIVTPEPRENLIKSARNIPGVKTTITGVLSVYDVLGCSKFVIDEAAVSRIEEVYAQ
jgi:large subunit ribosomal protein L4